MGFVLEASASMIHWLSIIGISTRRDVSVSILSHLCRCMFSEKWQKCQFLIDVSGSFHRSSSLSPRSLFTRVTERTTIRIQNRESVWFWQLRANRFNQIVCDNNSNARFSFKKQFLKIENVRFFNQIINWYVWFFIKQHRKIRPKSTTHLINFGK